MRPSLVVLPLAAAALVAVPATAAAAEVDLAGTFSAKAEVPPLAGSGSGKAAITVDTKTREVCWKFTKIKGKWSSAPLPEGEAGCKTTIAGDALFMSSKTEVADAAWLWMEHLSKPETIARLTYETEGTLLPPLNSLLEGEEIIEEKPVLEGFIDLMKCGVASTVNNPKFPRVETILNEELSKAMYGEQSAEEALDNTAQQAEAILSRG